MQIRIDLAEGDGILPAHDHPVGVTVIPANGSEYMSSPDSLTQRLDGTASIDRVERSRRPMPSTV
jgi:hypothetical protein